MSIKGYKVFNNDWTCRGFQYKIGETYKYEGEIEVCKEGFHFCKKLIDCFKYYDFNPKNKVAEVEALGFVETKDNKSVTNEIKELSWYKVLDVLNEGKGNTGVNNNGDSNTGNYNTGFHNSGHCNNGFCNSGNWNNGNYNTGFRNSGHKNTGEWNNGNRNSGKGNTGNRNSGKGNTGNWNTGNWNKGNCNTGNWNKGDYNIGSFNTNIIDSQVYLFNKPTEWTMKDWVNSRAYRIQ